MSICLFYQHTLLNYVDNPKPMENEYAFELKISPGAVPTYPCYIYTSTGLKDTYLLSANFTLDQFRNWANTPVTMTIKFLNIKTQLYESSWLSQVEDIKVFFNGMELAFEQGGQTQTSTALQITGPNGINYIKFVLTVMDIGPIDPTPQPKPTLLLNDVEEIIDDQIVQELAQLQARHRSESSKPRPRGNVSFSSQPRRLNENILEGVQEKVMNEFKGYASKLAMDTAKNFGVGTVGGAIVSDLVQNGDIQQAKAKLYEYVESNVGHYSDQMRNQIKSAAPEQLKKLIPDWTPSIQNITDFKNNPEQFMQETVQNFGSYGEVLASELKDVIVSQIQEKLGFDVQFLTKEQKQLMREQFDNLTSNVTIFDNPYELSQKKKRDGHQYINTVMHKVNDYVNGSPSELELMAQLYDVLISPEGLDHVGSVYDSFIRPDFGDIPGSLSKFQSYYARSIPDSVNEMINYIQEGGWDQSLNIAGSMGIVGLSDTLAKTAPFVSPLLLGLGAAGISYSAYVAYQQQNQPSKLKTLGEQTIEDRQHKLVIDFLRANISPQTEYDFELKSLTDSYLDKRQVYDIRLLVKTPLQRRQAEVERLGDNINKIKDLAHKVAHQDDEYYHKQSNLGFYHDYDYGSTSFFQNFFLPDAERQNKLAQINQLATESINRNAQAQSQLNNLKYLKPQSFAEPEDYWKVSQQMAKQIQNNK